MGAREAGAVLFALAQQAMSPLPERASGRARLHGVWIVGLRGRAVHCYCSYPSLLPINSDLLFVAFGDWLAAAHCGTSRAFGRNCMRGQL